MGQLCGLNLLELMYRILPRDVLESNILSQLPKKNQTVMKLCVGTAKELKTTPLSEDTKEIQRQVGLGKIMSQVETDLPFKRKHEDDIDSQRELNAFAFRCAVLHFVLPLHCLSPHRTTQSSFRWSFKAQRKAQCQANCGET